MGSFKQVQQAKRESNYLHSRAPAYRLYGSAYQAWFQLWATLETGYQQELPNRDGVPMDLSDLVPTSLTREGTSTGVADDPKFAKDHPEIWLLMSSATDKTGAVRKGASLVMFIQDGMWTAKLSERNAGYDLWGGGPTHQAALQSLTARLRERPVPWRRAELQPGARGRGK